MTCSLVTPRLLLSPLDRDAAAAVLAGQRRPDWAAGYPTEGDVLIAGLLLASDTEPEPPYGHYALTLTSTGQIIGGIGLHHPPDETGATEIGYGIAVEHRGQGLTTEAVRALVAALPPAARTITARPDPDNLASIGVLRRAGFTADPDGWFRLHREGRPQR